MESALGFSMTSSLSLPTLAFKGFLKTISNNLQTSIEYHDIKKNKYHPIIDIAHGKDLDIKNKERKN